jgi:DNA modification methylase
MHSVRIGIEYVQTSQLREWRRNPRFISDEQHRALAENIRKYGIIDPLIVDQQYRIVGGHQRLKVLKDLGLKTVPVVKLQLTGRDFKILNLALNKISGEWDREKLVPLLEEFAPLQELDLTGFTRQEANLLLEEFRIDDDDAKDETAPLPEKPAAKPGDLYKLGNHRLLCGDATNSKSWESLMDDRKGHLAVTDPPYGVDYEYAAGKGFHLDQFHRKKFIPKRSAAMAGDQTSETALTTLPLLFSNLIPHAAVYITAGTNLMLDIYEWLREQGIHYGVAMVWDKGPPAVVSWNRYHPEHENIIFCGKGALPGGSNKRWFGDKNETTVWRIPIDDRGTKIHRAQKPVALYERAMINSSAPGEIVVDPFAGSGTCIIAAEKHGRRAYCIELDPRYVDVAVKRWEHFTGNRSQRIATSVAPERLEKISETLVGELKG